MKTFAMILSIIPALIDIIKKVEELMPETGNGAAKMEMVTTILQSAYDSIEEAMPAIESVINALVGLFNKFGIFSKE